MTRLRTEQLLTPKSAVTSSSPQDALPARIYSTAFGIPIHTKRDGEQEEAVVGTRSRSAKDKKPTPFYTIIHAGLLIPGVGEPINDAALVLSGKLIVWVGPSHSLPPSYTDSSSSSSRTFSIPVAMPGLWDVHVHFEGAPTGTDDGDYATVLLQHPATAAARLARGCWEAIQRGYTSVRDVAGLGCEVARAVDDGTIVGPNIYSSGACLTQTGGHGDPFSLPAGDAHNELGIAGAARSGHWGSTQSMIVDGPDECRRGVRLQIRRGAKCIKLFASGGVLSLDDDPVRAQFSAEELDVIVSEAKRQGRSVAAHVHGKPGILAAVRAGVATVEHVSFADAECVALIREKGTVYVATRTIVELLMAGGGKGLSEYQWEKAKLCASHNLKAYQMAIEAGVNVALGTDTPPGFNMAVEIEYAVQAGMTPLEAIRAATANGPLAVGEMAPKTGQLKAGYEADILGLLCNPVEDVKVLQDKQNIAWVWKGGRLFKGPDVGPWGEDPL